MTKVILVTGIPAVGKSTISRLLAVSFPRSVVLVGDDLRELVVSGLKDPNDPWDAETRSQYYLSYENEAALARNFLRSGFTVVIDDVVHHGDLYDEWRRYFEGIAHQVVLLMPSLEVAIRRNLERPEKTVPEETLHKLYDHFSQSGSDGWLVVDNSQQSPEETVRLIRERLPGDEDE
jgi:tRNA uridine 5-carbamoylmethylation protein Kti12